MAARNIAANTVLLVTRRRPAAVEARA